METQGEQNAELRIEPAPVLRETLAKEKAMPVINRIAPCLWFDHQAEDAAKLYVSVFPNSKIVSVTRYAKA